MLLGGLLTKGLKAAVKSKPYQQFRKKAMKETADLYKKAPQMDPGRASLKDKKFMKKTKKNPKKNSNFFKKIFFEIYLSIAIAEAITPE